MTEEFIHHFEPAPGGAEDTLLLLHGTGGNEQDLVPWGSQLRPDAALLSPRGQVSERGAPRFFRRVAEGVLDLEDWRTRSTDLAEFVRKKTAALNRSTDHLIALGYSNGANIAQGLLLLQPDVLAGAILIRPMFVTDPEPAQSLAGKRILILSGQYDPLMPAGDPERLLNQYRKRGADVRLETIPAGHEPTGEDFHHIVDWFANI